MKEVQDHIIIIVCFVYVIILPLVLYFYFVANEGNFPDFLENGKMADPNRSGMIVRLNQLVDKSWVKSLHSYLFWYHEFTFDKSKF